MRHERLQRRHGALRAAAVLAAVAATAGCSAGGGEADSGDATASVWAGTDNTVLPPSLEEWNAANPDKQIEYETYSNSDYSTAMDIAIGAGSGPTIVGSYGGADLQSYVEAGTMLDLTDAVASVQDRFLSSVFDVGVIDGTTYAIPSQPITPVLFFYNTDVLDAVGLDEPETWDEILDAIPVLADAGYTPISLGGAEAWTLLMWEEYLVDRVAGPDAFEAVLAGEEGAWSDPGIIEANTKLQQLIEAGAFGNTYGSVSANSGADVALLSQGKAGMLLQGSWVYATMQKEDPDFVGSSLAYNTFPAIEGGDGDPTNLVGNPSFYFSVSADASEEEQETAIEYLTEGMWDETYTDGYIDINQVPPLSDVDLDSLADADFGQAVYDLTDQAGNFQLSWDQALPDAQATELLTALSDLFNTSITPEEFSTRMDATIGS